MAISSGITRSYHVPTTQTEDHEILSGPCTTVRDIELSHPAKGYPAPRVKRLPHIDMFMLHGL